MRVDKEKDPRFQEPLWKKKNKERQQWIKDNLVEAPKPIVPPPQIVKPGKKVR